MRTQEVSIKAQAICPDFGRQPDVIWINFKNTEWQAFWYNEPFVIGQIAEVTQSAGWNERMIQAGTKYRLQRDGTHTPSPY